MIGLGFRRDFADELIQANPLQVDFVEFAPENWMGMGGYWKQKLDAIADKYPVHCHGLSLSLGSPEELDWKFVRQIGKFLKQYNVRMYSEHLSYTKSANAHLYDLLPIPFRQDAVKHIVQRITQVQEILERKIAIENVSYYTPVAAEMSEPDFIRTIVEEADCELLLDVNNVYVNAFNHGYNAREFIQQMPLHKVAYIHMAGHEQLDEDLIIDTHGQAIIDPVYELFDWTLSQLKPVPVLLERDYNYSDLHQLQSEINELRSISKKHWETKHVKA